MTAGLILLGGGAAVGLFGSLLGLGGGILLVPLMTLGFGLPLREAVAISLVSVIVTSSAGAGVYLRRHLANLRLGMVLELFTACGALLGGLIAFSLPAPVLEGLFAILLTWVAISMLRRASPAPAAPAPVDDGAMVDDAAISRDEGLRAPSGDGDRAPAEAAAVVDSIEPASAPPSLQPADAPFTSAAFGDSLSGPGYHVVRLRFGMVGAVFAGIVSALLGVGGGIIKVPLMTLAMGVPMKVATATSNMMIGITATSSAVIYLLRDEIDPYVAGPVALGVFVGASFGATDREPDRRARAAVAVHRRPARDGCPDGGQGGGPVSIQDGGRPAGRDSVEVAFAIETTVARLLVAGTYLAIGLVLVGVIGMLAAGVDPFAHGAPPPFDLAQIPAEILALNPLGFLWLGLVLVLALPIGRVVVAGIGFLAAGDRRLALVSLGVILVVMASVLAAQLLGG